jgi:MSHA biogenesis protein MshM
MYLGHFGFNEAPFRITPHTDFFFAGANRGATLEALLYAIAHDEGIVKVSGEVGSGKTMLCRVLMERLPAEVETIYLANPSVARDEILIAIADELKLDLGSERSTRVLRSLQQELVRLYSQGRRVVVLIDEAHAMPRETLEEIRLLSNLETNRRKLLQIVLFGQPELDAHLNGADMRQLKERITHSFRLAPMPRADIESYIEFRLRAAGYRGPNPFTAAAMKLITEASEGLTRRINILADKALLAAFAANTHSVGQRELKRAIEDSEFYRPQNRLGRRALAGLAATAGLAAGLALSWVFLKGERSPRDVRPAATAAVTASPSATPAVSSAPVAKNAAAPGAANPHATAPFLARAAEETKPARELARPADAVPGPAGVPAAPQKGKLVQQRFLATQDWLESAPEKHVAIQLMTVKDTELSRLESFLSKASRVVAEDELHVYSVKIDGTQHYRAAYGDFSGNGEAVAAMKELPPLLSAQNPYQRSVARMRSQNRQ